MIYNKQGEIFEHEGKTYIVGEEVFAISSAYRNLIGRITEIRTGNDRETENEEPDIYCDFEAPILNQDKESLKVMCGNLDKLCLDGIIMAPEMLVTVRTRYDDYPTIKIYALVNEFTEDEFHSRSVRLFASYELAEFEMRRMLLVEKKNGCLARWSDDPDYMETQDCESRFEAGNYRNRLVLNYIEEYEMPLEKSFVTDMYAIGLANKRREDVAEQIKYWDMSPQVRHSVLRDTTLSSRIEKELEGKELYIEEYSEAVAEVSHALVSEHKKAEKLLQIAKKEGKI